MKILACHCIVALSLAITSLIHAAAPDGLPSGIAASDWSSIRAAHEAWRHGFQKTAAGFEATNPGQQWRTQFDGRGFTAQPKEGGWQWGLELKSYGFAGEERAMSDTPAAQAGGQRLTYQWDAMVQEWFVNDQRGLEHGFTVKQRPASTSTSELAFTLGVRGNLKPVITSDALGVQFQNDAGATVLTYAGLKVWDADGKVLRSRFEPASEGVRLLLDEREARYPITIDPIAQHAYAKAGNPDINDNFGATIAISGETVVVGAYHEDGSGTGVNPADNDLSADSGAAYVFVRNSGVWVQQAYLKASNTGSGDLFGCAVAIDGDTIVVGAYLEDGSGTGVNPASNELSSSSGAAYVFVRNGTVWSQQAYLKASNTGISDWFGVSVAVSGDAVVVGATGEAGSGAGVNPASDELANNAGAVYVFLRSGTVWYQHSYLKSSNPGANDSFGSSVSVSGDSIAVSARYEDGSGTGVNPPVDELAPGAGAVYVFVRSSGVWAQQAYLKAFNAGAGDDLNAVFISGDTLVAGAIREDGDGQGVNPPSNNNAPDAGAAYVFVRQAGVWSQQAYLKAHNSQVSDLFGESVGISGDVIAVGAGYEDGGGTGINPPSDESSPSAGAVYVYIRHVSAWSQQAYLKASNAHADDQFGGSVAVSGDTVVVGAMLEKGIAAGVNPSPVLGVSSVGAAYFFSGLGPSEMFVEQPQGSLVESNGVRSFGGVVTGNHADMPFFIRNQGLGDLVLTGTPRVAIGGAHAAMFVLTAIPDAAISGQNGFSLFGIRFTPVGSGLKTATLSIPSNDADKSPFIFQLNGAGLAYTQDSDGDGLNDASESQLAALGFDWQVTQTALVQTLMSNANGAGLYTPSQVQALNVGTPLLQKNPTTGNFTLTLGIERSTNLTTFTPLPMTAPQCTINGQGKLEFQFPSPGNAAFFRVQAQ